MLFSTVLFLCGFAATCCVCSDERRSPNRPTTINGGGDDDDDDDDDGIVDKETRLASQFTFDRCSIKNIFYLPGTLLEDCVSQSSSYLHSTCSFTNNCPPDSFILDSMSGCHRWLTCDDYTSGHIIIGELIGSGAVKKVYLASWSGHAVVVSIPMTIDGIIAYPNDFEQGLLMHSRLGPSDHLVTFVGYCRNPLMIITEYHRHGNANNLDIVLKTSGIGESGQFKMRFRLCKDYAAILKRLHDNSSGTRVMCDSNSLEKTLEQFLITDSFRLLLNDVDALPNVNGPDGRRKIVCGHRPLLGSFVAPEQRWPHKDRLYVDSDMPGYDEKTDIWKVPDVCAYFLKGAVDRDIVIYRLFGLHARCKSVIPDARPTASDILETYEIVWKELFV